MHRTSISRRGKDDSPENNERITSSYIRSNSTFKKNVFFQSKANIYKPNELILSPRSRVSLRIICQVGSKLNFSSMGRRTSVFQKLDSQMILLQDYPEIEDKNSSQFYNSRINLPSMEHRMSTMNVLKLGHISTFESSQVKINLKKG